MSSVPSPKKRNEEEEDEVDCGCRIAGRHVGATLAWKVGVSEGQTQSVRPLRIGVGWGPYLAHSVGPEG